ncbi:MAG: fumarylacetoacetate hydrolase family protein [Prolixibacteraceae bacterium]|nr:fumarylacetoacetate hydrolase family protein [Prolixibacteraceae bacterium]MBN2774635.1 fumarylacetoacetate hydrolase family protein [Prolixibacteraceae bacterium]
MKIYKTIKGILIEEKDRFFLVQNDWDGFINNDNLFSGVLSLIKNLEPIPDVGDILKNELLPPIGSQEIWASGVTYMRSKSARMEESKDAGGGDFYDKVYEAERPELFFKSTAYRSVGPGEKVRIRKDSTWNVPEPELTLMISSSGKIIGYTIGNDMSSRDIEGQNPLYLPQAKTYDGSAAIGPCIYVTEKPLLPTVRIELEIIRNGKSVYTGDVNISQIKRKFTDLAEFLFRETGFPAGCLLMTGTGIVPPNDFTLASGDVVKIRIEPIGELVNEVE